MMDDRYKILEKYNFQVPRYTSFPPATQFQKVENQTPYLEWLSKAGENISLYVHIPFCARLCHYCGCHMRVVNNYQPVLDYLDTLQKEIACLKHRLPENVQVSHLHFGGGSPTIIRPGDFRRLVQVIKDNFPFKPGLDFSLEADPRNLSEAKISAYKLCGVNRISFGVQDFNEDVLNLINRPQPFHVTFRALQICRDYGIDNINFDLMYGLPGQSRDSILRTMELAISLQPSRIAYFGYAHVPWLKRHMNLMPQDRMPTPHDRSILQEVGACLLTSNGYRPIGIDHFCLPEDSMLDAYNTKSLHRNFQGYTTDATPCLIGLGASSISSFPSGYVQNQPDARLYMQSVTQGVWPISRALSFKKQDYPIKDIIEQIMCYLCVDLEEIRRKHSLPSGIFEAEKARLKDMESDGIITLKDNSVTINEEYRILARVACEIFDPYAHQEAGMQRHAQAV